MQKGLENSSQPWTVYLLDGDNKDRDGDYPWTYLFSV